MRATVSQAVPPSVPRETMAGTFGFFLHATLGIDREWKGNMQRRFDRKLWTLILSLLLACGTVSMPTYVRADLAGGDTNAPGAPPPDGGDPDWPTGGAPGRNMKAGPPKGANVPAQNAYEARTRWVTWMKWAIRVAYGSTWRVFFRV